MDMLVRVLAILMIMALFSGCGGSEEPVVMTSTPEATLAPATTTPPAVTSPPVTTPPPTPGPGAFFAEPATNVLDIVPGDVYKVSEISEGEYFTLPFPTKTFEYVSGTKVTYRTIGGAIFTLKFSTISGSDFFFEGVLNKMEGRGERVAEDTLTQGEGTIDVIHRYKLTDYLGTIVKKGVFIYFLTVGEDELNTETYILDNMDFLFLPIGYVAEGEDKAVKEVDMSTSDTLSEDVIPAGAETSPLPDATYKYSLRLPEPMTHTEAIIAEYSQPEGDIIIFKYSSLAKAESFSQSFQEKMTRSSNERLNTITLTENGKSIEVHHKVSNSDGTYKASLVQRGPFVLYINLWSSEYETEAFMKRHMPYLFE